MSTKERTRVYTSFARPTEPRVKHCANPDNMPTQEKVARPIYAKPRGKDWQ